VQPAAEARVVAAGAVGQDRRRRNLPAGGLLEQRARQPRSRSRRWAGSSPSPAEARPRTTPRADTESPLPPWNTAFLPCSSMLVLRPSELREPALDDSQACVVTFGGEGELDERRAAPSRRRRSGPRSGSLARCAQEPPTPPSGMRNQRSLVMSFRATNGCRSTDQRTRVMDEPMELLQVVRESESPTSRCHRHDKRRKARSCSDK
jgi:hypothetical protein